LGDLRETFGGRQEMPVPYTMYQQRLRDSHYFGHGVA
jgi:hypothetical protein